MKPHTFWKQLQHRRCSTQGLTLVETLIAVVTAGVVIGGAGYGLAAITAANRTEDARTERRMEMSRALEFISDEVKSARGIARDPAGELTVQSPSFSLPSGAQLLMVVNTPRASESIVYYLAPPPTNSVWQGPQVLYRWGPAFDAAGNYSNSTTPTAWTGRPLLDLVANTPGAATCDTTNQTQIPANSANRRGFFICLDTDGDTQQGRLASLQLSSTFNRVIGGNERLNLNTQAFARNSSSGSGGGGLPPGLLNPSNNGDLTPPDDVSLRFQVLGGAIQCGTRDVPVTTDLYLTAPGATTATKVTLNPNSPLNQPPGTVERVRVESIARLSSVSCGSNFTISTGPGRPNSNNFRVLKNGDSVPNFVPYNNQASLDTFLRPILGADGRVRIRDNQVIYLFELGTTNTGSAAFDMQDNVVLVTVNPEQTQP
ncbi:hypothetical protein VZH09_06340 [Synechococcus elongatus IITB7]|uniref:PulJ/GspJ family protein n=1 Tax=Synechococcus elongatus TaxID=32046 RepID=UPI0030D55D1B